MKFNYENLRNNSKNLFNASEEVIENENIHLTPLGDISVFLNKYNKSLDINSIDEKDNSFILKFICEKLIEIILHNRKSERILDSASYCLLLIIFNV